MKKLLSITILAAALGGCSDDRVQPLEECYKLLPPIDDGFQKEVWAWDFEKCPIVVEVCDECKKQDDPADTTAGTGAQGSNETDATEMTDGHTSVDSDSDSDSDGLTEGGTDTDSTDTTGNETGTDSDSSGSDTTDATETGSDSSSEETTGGSTTEGETCTDSTQDTTSDDSPGTDSCDDGCKPKKPKQCEKFTCFDYGHAWCWFRTKRNGAWRLVCVGK